MNTADGKSAGRDDPRTFGKRFTRGLGLFFAAVYFPLVFPACSAATNSAGSGGGKTSPGEEKSRRENLDTEAGRRKSVGDKHGRRENGRGENKVGDKWAETAGKPPATFLAPAADAWPMFRGGSALSGVAAAEICPPLKLRWSFKTGGAVKSSPAIVDGRVFFGSDDGKVYALGLAHGEKLWAFTAGDAVQSPPCVYSGTVFVGSDDSKLYALDARTGRLRWAYKTGDRIVGGPNVVRSPEGRELWIVVGSHDRRLHCVNAADGERRWTYKTKHFVNGTPAVWKGRIVFGGCDAVLHVVSAVDGKRLAAVELGERAHVPGSAAVFAGEAFVGDYDNEFVCVELSSARILWRCKGDAPYFSAPAVAGELVLIGGRDGKLRCASRRTGKRRWTFSARGNVDGAPVVSGDKVLCGADDGRLYVVSLANGKELWSYELGEALSGSPAVVAGTVVVGCEDGAVYAFSTGGKSGGGEPARQKRGGFTGGDEQ